MNWVWTTLSGKRFEPTRKRNGPLSPITLLLDRMMSNMKRKKLSIEEPCSSSSLYVLFFCIFRLHHFLPALSSNTFVQLAEKCLFWEKIFLQYFNIYFASKLWMTLAVNEKCNVKSVGILIKRNRVVIILKVKLWWFKGTLSL